MTPLLVFLTLGIVVGALSSFLGIGGGVIVVTVLVATNEFTQHEAQATALAFMVPTAIVGVLSVHRHGMGDLRASALVGATGAIGAVLGALLALSLAGGTLRYLFAVVIGAMGLAMLRRKREPVPAPPDGVQ